MFEFLENLFSGGKYKNHPEAIVISCFFNPQNSAYRIKAFNEFYDSIKHLNHQIIECIIGDAQPQLELTANIKRINTESLLWHKETLLNYIVSKLDKKYKYIFWVDADVLFTNKNWLVEGVEQLKKNSIIQPFEYCVHLNKDELKPSFNVDEHRKTVSEPRFRHPMLWRSFCANYATTKFADSENYDRHGHVGFAWAARREVLEQVPLYDKALIGGADHIIAHAAAGHIPHTCICKSFTENLDEVTAWSKQFFAATQGKIGYVQGDLYHIWHGDIDKRQYLKRIREFGSTTNQISHRDENGLFVHKGDNSYMHRYFAQREVVGDDNFLNSMAIGYLTDNAGLGTLLGGNPAGAIIGDMLNDSEERTQHTHSHVPETQETPIEYQPDNSNTTDSTQVHNENFS